MRSITLKNFRCFREEQTAKLAPLTLLVGENSTGKTSFMAMIRALWDVAYRYQIPDFKEPPYDLGSFDEIAYNRGTRGGQVDTFEAGFDPNNLIVFKNDATDKVRPYHLNITFAKDGTVPVPVRRRMTCEDLWIEEFLEPKNRDFRFRVGTEKGSWEFKASLDLGSPSDFAHYAVDPFFYTLPEEVEGLSPLEGSEKITKKDLERLREFWGFCFTGLFRKADRPYASAPVRSEPKRTYDPARLSSDPEGDYVPMYLANAYARQRRVWNYLKNELERFGQASGLFDEITVKHLGKTLGSPFQLQVRKFAGRRKGPWKNLVDVGYGISQVLPVVTELFRQDAAPLVLLQQPEVHLHPSAQAALGTLFCQIAVRSSQLVVETHSDYIVDRVRMEVRDNNIPLKPEDVSILFFERKELDVHIHSLRLDEEGNILDVPPNYRNFFMEESRRLWGL
ncbi:MAG: AAA family ATPase [Candidatus Dadabacteria bacterium]|nr:AAA family ATPase [Candidatus Dadabacteria bacterium]MDE0477185.1 AAA family ATPase [Candidatus Dadabacteria bacterium]